MARVGWVDPRDAVEGDDKVVTSIWHNTPEEAVTYAQRLHQDNGWHVWARDDDLNVIWDSEPVRCKLCSEPCRDDDIAEMYDPDAEEEVIGMGLAHGIVHPQCGLWRGWELA